MEYKNIVDLLLDDNKQIAYEKIPQKVKNDIDNKVDKNFPTISAPIIELGNTADNVVGIKANNSESDNKPLLVYDKTDAKWKYSNDGNVFNDIGSGSGAVSSVNGKTGDVIITKDDIGLNNVINYKQLRESFSAYQSKDVPNASDTIVINDSEDGNKPKKISVGSLNTVGSASELQSKTKTLNIISDFISVQRSANIYLPFYDATIGNMCFYNENILFQLHVDVDTDNSLLYVRLLILYKDNNEYTVLRTVDIGSYQVPLENYWIFWRNISPRMQIFDNDKLLITYRVLDEQNYNTSYILIKAFSVNNNDYTLNLINSASINMNEELDENGMVLLDDAYLIEITSNTFLLMCKCIKYMLEAYSTLVYVPIRISYSNNNGITYIVYADAYEVNINGQLLYAYLAETGRCVVLTGDIVSVIEDNPAENSFIITGLTDDFRYVNITYDFTHISAINIVDKYTIMLFSIFASKMYVTAIRLHSDYSGVKYSDSYYVLVDNIYDYDYIATLSKIANNDVVLYHQCQISNNSGTFIYDILSTLNITFNADTNKYIIKRTRLNYNINENNNVRLVSKYCAYNVFNSKYLLFQYTPSNYGSIYSTRLLEIDVDADVYCKIRYDSNSRAWKYSNDGKIYKSIGSASLNLSNLLFPFTGVSCNIGLWLQNNEFAQLGITGVEFDTSEFVYPDNVLYIRSQLKGKYMLSLIVNFDANNVGVRGIRIEYSANSGITWYTLREMYINPLGDIFSTLTLSTIINSDQELLLRVLAYQNSGNYLGVSGIIQLYKIDVVGNISSGGESDEIQIPANVIPINELIVNNLTNYTSNPKG